MKSRYLALVPVVALTLLGLSMSALSVPVHYSANEALLDEVLTEMEIEYTMTLDELGDPLWTLTLSGILITIVSYDKTAPGQYASLLFYSGWATDTEISLSAINDWNMHSRFGRAYLDDSRDPVIELDLLLSGGVTSETIQEYIQVFVATVSDLGVALQL